MILFLLCCGVCSVLTLYFIYFRFVGGDILDVSEINLNKHIS